MRTDRPPVLQSPGPPIRGVFSLLLALALVGCGDEPKTPPRLVNFKPAIPSVEVSQSLPVTVSYESGDYEIGHFEWTVEAGEIEGNGAPEITYRAPDEAGNYKLTVSVTYAEEEGATVALDTVVKVVPGADTAPQGSPATTEAPAKEPETPAAEAEDTPAETEEQAAETMEKSETEASVTETAETPVETEASVTETAATPAATEETATAAMEAPAKVEEAATAITETPVETEAMAAEPTETPIETATTEPTKAPAEDEDETTTSAEEAEGTAVASAEVPAEAEGTAVASTETPAEPEEVAASAAEASVETKQAATAAAESTAQAEAPATESTETEPATTDVAAVAPQPETATTSPPPAAAAAPATPSRIDDVKARGELKAIVQIDFPPFSFYGEDGRRVGFDVDMVHEFARRWLGDAGKASLLPVPTDARIANLLNGRGDIIAAALTDTPARRQEVDFSITYFKDGQRLLVPDGTSIDDVCDLAGKKVAVIRASTSLDNLKTAAGDCGFTPDLVEFRRHADAVEALIKGEVAVFTSDGIALEAFAKDGSLKVVGNHFSDEPYGIGVPKDDRRFRQLVDGTLAEMQADGTFAAIYQKWFGDTIAPYPLDLTAAEAAPVEVAAATSSKAPPVVEPVAPAGPPPKEYVVQPGDTLSKIAGKVWGDVGPNSWRRIYEANRDLIGDDPAKIEVGMKLAVPQA